MKPKFSAFFQQVVRDYEREHPGVKVEWVDFPWDIIQSKLVTRIVSGKPPALVNLNVPWADEFARDGLLLPVDEQLGGGYNAGAMADLNFGGKTYGFPMYANVAVLAYRPALFARAGLAGAPASFDEQLAYARTIAQRTGVAGIAPALSKIDGLMLQQGLPVLEHGRAVFDSPRHVAFIQKLAETYRAGGLLKDGLFAEDNFPYVLDAYKGGRLAMLLAPPTAMRRIETDAPDVYASTEVTPSPLGPTGIADGGWLIHFAVPRGVDTKMLPEVGRFARYLTSDEVQLRFARAASVFPTTVNATKDPFFAKLPAHAGAAEKAVVAGARSIAHARTMYVAGIDDYDALRRILVKAVEAGVTGRANIALSLQDAARQWNRKLAKRGQP